MIDYDTIPPLIREAIVGHVRTGRPTGSFVNAVLSNDLREAFAYADEDNISAMHSTVAYLHNQCPLGCSGSPERVAHWRELGGLEGLKREREDSGARQSG